VLFFNASWCPSCKSAREDFEANAGDFMDINLVLVDYDHSADLQKKYGVTYQHTFVQIAADGKAVTKWNGGGAAELVDNTMMKEM
jgi:thiol-disulfide isomerase/thioredoxin